ncbi:MAG TPA: DegT/DnrJ/EryC1/StrS family aminotransferase [Candidatus Baltobacteraceae bacterium]|nr:DegT/DnrJ/EryC1/StrS family aminotransferase [Candidatus Baltobacteraceae bacterium]
MDTQCRHFFVNTDMTARRIARKKRTMPPMGLGECLIGAEERRLVLQALRNKELFRYYGFKPGAAPPMVAALEREVCAATTARFALGVTSGTAALEVALGALGVGPGDEVIIPVWSWISCFTAVVRMGARPVLAEVDDTLNLAPTEITRLSTPATKAVLVVHYQGVPADMDAIMAAARGAGIKVLEDCAESAGARYHGHPVGVIGDVGTFSLQARKVVTAGEGGIVVTNDPRLYERAVRMSDVGQYRAFHEKLCPGVGPAFSGGNYRMSELSGAVALAQWRRLPTMIARLRRLRARLMKQIGKLPGMAFRRIPDPSGDLGFETYLYLPSAAAAARFRAALTEEGVNCTQHTGTYCHYARPYCLSGQAHAPGASPFARISPWPAEGYREGDFPRTRALIERMVAIPIGVLYEPQDIDSIAAAIRRAVPAS